TESSSTNGSCGGTIRCCKRGRARLKRCKHYKHKDVEIINNRFYMVCMNCGAVLYEIGGQAKGLASTSSQILEYLSAEDGGEPVNVQSPKRHITRERMDYEEARSC